MQGGPSWVLGRRDDDLLFAWKRLGSFFFFSSRRRETRGRDVRLREFLLRSRALGRRHERERESDGRWVAATAERWHARAGMERV